MSESVINGLVSKRAELACAVGRTQARLRTLLADVGSLNVAFGFLTLITRGGPSPIRT